VTGGKGVAIKSGVEPCASPWRALAAEGPFKDGRHDARSQRSDQHAPPKATPGWPSPGQGRRGAEQPQWTVSTVGDDERQQAEEARPALITSRGYGEPCRQPPIEGDEPLDSGHHLLSVGCARFQFGAGDLQLERLVHVHPYLGIGEGDGPAADIERSAGPSLGLGQGQPPGGEFEKRP